MLLVKSHVLVICSSPLPFLHPLLENPEAPSVLSHPEQTQWHNYLPFLKSGTVYIWWFTKSTCDCCFGDWPCVLCLQVNQEVHQTHDRPETHTDVSVSLFYFHFLVKRRTWVCVRDEEKVTLVPDSPGIPLAPSAPARPCYSRAGRVWNSSAKTLMCVTLLQFKKKHECAHSSSWFSWRSHQALTSPRALNSSLKNVDTFELQMWAGAKVFSD